MDAFPEVIFATGNTCFAYDSENGNVVENLKGPNIVPRTLSLIGEDFLIGADRNKPLLVVWTLSKKVRTLTQLVVPGLVTALAVSNCGSYCIAGIKKDLYVWKVCTGELLKIVPRHYQDITCIRFSVEDSHILTGGKDGHVNVWLLSQLTSVVSSGNEVKPRFTWSHHSADITDIFVGSLGQYARVATVSLDMTCRLYELSSGVLISTICMDAPLTAVAMDTMEYLLFLGDDKGNLHRVNLYDRLPTEIHGNELNDSEFKIHESKIVSLSVSIEGDKLVSSSEDASIRVWDIQSLSCVLRIPLDGKVTNAFIALKPTCLMDETVMPNFGVGHFRREVDSACRDDGCVKLYESKIGARSLSKMVEIYPEMVYNPAQLRLDSVMTGGTDQSATNVVESQFQQALHGDTVSELMSVNKQLYSYVVNRAFDKLSSDSD